MKIRKNDQVLIISGKDKGRTGKVIKAMPSDLKVLIEHINMKKKHVRPKREGEKGQIIEVPVPISISNMKLICPKCGKATRVGYRVEKDRKTRVCKKCEQAI